MTAPASTEDEAQGPDGATRPALPVLVADGWPDYRLIDSGHGRKLERYGDLVLVRPEPQAMWSPQGHPAWDAAAAEFTGEADEEGPGRWRVASGVPEQWTVAIGPVRTICRLTGFRHVGLFPEQRPHWDDMVARVARRVAARRPPEILNLFGYTGAASLLLAAAGAHVTHVDASRKAIAWARENQALSGLEDRPIRWLCEDASKFVAREVRRGRRYDGIVLDPPKFGRGPKNETWSLLEDLPPLMADLSRLLDRDSDFLVLTAYAIRLSALALGRLVAERLAPLGGEVEAGELAIREEASGRLLPTSLYARWSAAR